MGTLAEILKTSQSPAPCCARSSKFAISSLRIFAVLHLSGDMERYVWSMNGKTLSEQHEIPIESGEVVRFVMINRTMMHHPMHLYGHFFRVLNGHGERSPLKHTVDVAPMATTVIEFDANQEKDWFFPCHILYHLAGGMARVVHYEGPEVDAATAVVRPELFDDPWYAFGEASVLSQMSDGSAQVSNTRNVFSTEWEGEYDVFGGYDRYFNRYLSLFGGVNVYDEGGGEDGVRGVFGLRLLLPLEIHSSVWGGTDGSFRWTAGKELQLTARLSAFAEGEYDTETDWEWVAGGEFVVNEYLSVVGQYHSDYGLRGRSRPAGALLVQRLLTTPGQAPGACLMLLPTVCAARAGPARQTKRLVCKRVRTPGTGRDLSVLKFGPPRDYRVFFSGIRPSSR